MTRWPKAALLMVLCCLILTACAGQSPQVTAYKAGEFSKVTAESAYKSIYAAYKAGHIPAEAMARTDYVYEEWRQAQAVYVSSMRAGQVSDDALHAVHKALLLLVDIASTYRLL